MLFTGNWRCWLRKESSKKYGFVVMFYIFGINRPVNVIIYVARLLTMKHARFPPPKALSSARFALSSLQINAQTTSQRACSRIQGFMDPNNYWTIGL